MDAQTRLRKDLTSVRLAPAYEAAVEKGIAAAEAAWPDTMKDKQLETARRVALQELAALIGWDGTHQHVWKEHDVYGEQCIECGAHR